MILVASYCRVSTDKDDQANSFEAQQRYFREYIDRQPDWELYRVYADEGISGTSTKKRVEFNRMINDAKMGKFKLIITKEVSRLSRNILDTIGYTRELKALGVGVLFMNDGINTLEPDAELRLSIMGSIAQEESRKTSSRVKWGQTRQMERGVVFGRSMLGYDVKGGRMTINPEGAELVRLIFHKYGIEKKGTSIIARELREEGYQTLTGNTKWSSGHIVKILRNEKYVGDLIQKKTYTPDYLSHQKKRNNGAEEKVILTDHHEPIIDRELWNIVQMELARRNRHGEPGVGHGNRYLFSGKIKCGECGAVFVSRKKYYKNGNVTPKWSCITAVNEGICHVDPMGNEVGCDIGLMFRDDFATEILKTATGAVLKAHRWSVSQVSVCTEDVIERNKITKGDSSEKLEYEIKEITKKKEDILDAFFSRDITKEEMRLMNERYDRQLEQLKINLIAAREREQLSYETSMLSSDIKAHIRDLIEREQNEIFFRNVLDTLIVYADRRVEVRLNLLPQKWRFVLDSMEDIRRRLCGNMSYFELSVPTKGSKWDTSDKLPQLQDFPSLFRDETGNVSVPGYLFSMMMEQKGTRRKEKPVWQIDVCVAVPDHRGPKRGGEAS